MQIIVPMAGEGSRFKAEGYTTPKPLIPTYSLRLKKVVPMVQAAVLDIPGVNTNSKIFFIGREFHKDQEIDQILTNYFPNSNFISLSELSDGQASTCMTAKDFANKDEEVFICSCDTGMDISEDFQEYKKDADVIAFTHRNHYFVEENPSAYGWLGTDNNNNVNLVSVKKSISSTPLNDHAIVGNFWFKKFSYFVDCYDEMARQDDRINNEFYVDQMMEYAVKKGLRTKVFEINKCLCWGTPNEYESYNKTLEYWKSFLEMEETWKV